MRVTKIETYRGTFSESVEYSLSDFDAHEYELLQSNAERDEFLMGRTEYNSSGPKIVDYEETVSLDFESEE